MSLNITCYSTGGLSNWFWHLPSRTLFDAGEGVAMHLRNYAFGIERIVLSHIHNDHHLGILSLIALRNSGRGAKDKDLKIYYPSGDWAMLDFIKFINIKFGDRLGYKLDFIPVRIGDKIKLDSNHYIEAFETKHLKRGLSLGYKIIEERSRLKPEFAGKNIPELLKSGVDKTQLNEAYEQITFAYCLDAYSINPIDIQNASVVIMDCTFLRKEDRDDITHFTLDEAVELCKQAKVVRVICAHFSPRYHPKDIDKACGMHDVEYIRINEVNEI